MNSIDFNKLIHSATYYLSYQEKIGRSFMVNESSLKYPVADYLTSLEIPLADIQLEYPHPILKKRTIDLVTKNPLGRIGAAFEFKIAKLETKYGPEQRRVFNDLMRLHFMVKSNGSLGFFLIVGTQSNFIQYFRSIVSQSPTANSKDLPVPQGFYSEWFKFSEGGIQTFDIKSVSGDGYEKIYNAFIKEYKTRIRGVDLVLPYKLQTKCVAISALSREFPVPYVGGIWQIE